MVILSSYHNNHDNNYNLSSYIENNKNMTHNVVLFLDNIVFIYILSL